MKKVRLTALLMAALMLVCTVFAGACAEEDPIVITAGRHSIPLSQVQKAYDDMVLQYEQYFASYGYTLGATEYEKIREIVLQNQEMFCVVDNIIEDRGYPELTDEEKEALRTKAQETYDEAYNYVKDYYVNNYGLSEEEAVKLCEDGMVEMGYSVDSLYDQMVENARYSAVYNDVTKDVTVTDDEVKAYYEETYVAPDREKYEGNIQSYEMNTNYYGTESHYVPEGYRAVSHILLTTPEEVETELDACSEKLDAAQEKMDGFVDELAELEVTPEEGAEPVEHRSAEEIQADIDAAKAEVEAVEAEYAEIKAKILPALQDKIDEIYAKIEAGEEFADLIDAYGEDPGMASNPDGYQVNKDSVIWATEFRDGAMSIENVGDVSDPVLSDFGVHIIKYLRDVPAGAVELSEEAFEDMKNELLTSKKDEAFQAAYAEWQEQYPATINADLVKLPSDQTEEVTDEAAAEEAAAETTDEAAAEETAAATEGN